MSQGQSIQAFSLTLDEAGLLADYRLLNISEREYVRKLVSVRVVPRRGHKRKELRQCEDAPFDRRHRQGGQGT